MATEAEIKNAIGEAISALDGIVGETEKFVDEHIKNRFGGAWNDICGQKISKMLVSAVEKEVDRELHFLFDYKSELEDMIKSIPPILETISNTYTELNWK